VSRARSVSHLPRADRAGSIQTVADHFSSSSIFYISICRIRGSRDDSESRSLTSWRCFVRPSPAGQSIGYHSMSFSSRVIFSFPPALSLAPFEAPRAGGKSRLAASAETSNESDTIKRRENIAGEGMGKRYRRGRGKEGNKRLTVMRNKFSSRAAR